MKIDVSIIIVTWNNENEIEDCINSIYKETKKNSFEIIVVDNDSSDKTVDLITMKYPEIKLIHSGGNIGFSKANNLGLTVSRGQYILFINPDVIILNQCIDITMRCLIKNENYGIVSCRLLNKDMSLQPSTFRFLRADLILIEQFNLHNIFQNTIGSYYNFSGNYNRQVDWCIGAFLLISRDDAIKVQGFTDKYFMYMEDLDFCYKVKKKLKKEIYYLYDASCIHLGGASEKQDINTSRSLKIFDSLQIFLNTHIPNKKIWYLNIYIASYKLKKIMFLLYKLFSSNPKTDEYIKKYIHSISYLKKMKKS